MPSTKRKQGAELAESGEYEEVPLEGGGFKRRRVGAKQWQRRVLRAWDAEGEVQGVRRRGDVRARPPTQPVQGVRRVVDVRARPPTQHVQGVRRVVTMRARPPTQHV